MRENTVATIANDALVFDQIQDGKLQSHELPDQMRLFKTVGEHPVLMNIATGTVVTALHPQPLTFSQNTREVAAIFATTSAVNMPFQSVFGVSEDAQIDPRSGDRKQFEKALTSHLPFRLQDEINRVLSVQAEGDESLP